MVWQQIFLEQASKTSVRGKMNVVGVCLWYIWLIFILTICSSWIKWETLDWLQRHYCNYTRAGLMVASAAFWLKEFRICFGLSERHNFQWFTILQLQQMKGRFDVDLKWLFFSLLVSQIQKPRQEKKNEKNKFQYL